MTVCHLCFKQHPPGACESFMAQQLRAKGVTSTGQFRQPIDLGPCPNCVAKDKEIARLKLELDGPHDAGDPVDRFLVMHPVDRLVEPSTVKMTQSERMKLRWAAKKAAEGKA